MREPVVVGADRERPSSSGCRGDARGALLVALGQDLLDNNGIYASFSLGPRICYDTMPFGFRNQLIFGAINFCRDHMEAAIELLCRHPLDELVGERQLEELQRDPMGFYADVYRSPERPLKTMVVWEQARVE